MEIVKVEEVIVKELERQIGKENILRKESIEEEYFYDAGTKDAVHRPEIVVFPKDTENVASVIKIANTYNVPVTPRGGGTGLAGAAVALAGGILMDFKYMNRILELNADGGYAIVEPAVKTSSLQELAAKQGMLYAGDPCSNDACVLAGNIATNAGGNRAVKYGVTADQIYEIELVTPTGEVVRLGGRVEKNATGYNLFRLITGSEGTLGIVTKATVKLYPLAEFMPTYLVVGKTPAQTIALVKFLKRYPQLGVLSLEIIDKKTAVEMEAYQKKKVFQEPSGTCLLIQFEAYDKEDLDYKTDLLKNIIASYDVVHFAQADDDVWPARRNWGKAVQSANGKTYSEDVVVPIDRLDAFIKLLAAMQKSYAYEFRFAGHAGDGNMHLAVIPKNKEAGEASYRKEFYQQIYGLGGRLSGEHGIGYKRKKYFLDLAEDVEIDLMKKIKNAWDPNGILNPGKLFL